jgi:hypothetical protein
MHLSHHLQRKFDEVESEFLDAMRSEQRSKIRAVHSAAGTTFNATILVSFLVPTDPACPSTGSTQSHSYSYFLGTTCTDPTAKRPLKCLPPENTNLSTSPFSFLPSINHSTNQLNIQFPQSILIQTAFAGSYGSSSRLLKSRQFEPHGPPSNSAVAPLSNHAMQRKLRYLEGLPVSTSLTLA